MESKTQIGGKQRYDEKMIGFLVAFEKRAKTMEVCCDFNKEVANSNESIDSSGSLPPSYVRHARSIKRSQRGRLRNPVPKLSKNDGSKNNAETSIIDVSVAGDEMCARETLNTFSSSIRQNNDYMILAVSDVVEVVINDIESEGCTRMENHIATFDAVRSTFTLPMEKRGKHDGDCGSTSANLEIISVSSSGSFVAVAPPPLKCGNGGRYEGKIHEILQPNALNHAQNSQKLHEQSILRPSSFSRENQSPIVLEEQNILRETKTNQKIVGVIFREPVHEVIPCKHGSLPSSDRFVYTVGDQVEITDGIYRRRSGRVVKTLGDIVQLDVGNNKPLYLFISPKMLQHQSDCLVLA